MYVPPPPDVKCPRDHLSEFGTICNNIPSGRRHLILDVMMLHVRGQLQLQFQFLRKSSLVQVSVYILERKKLSNKNKDNLNSRVRRKTFGGLSWVKQIKLGITEAGAYREFPPERRGGGDFIKEKRL